ncbi:hypothetical protein [Kitasatospora sp. NPDC050543]|uniref:hypothetical protein n=1 Tax=Kitasatospora sp. NPDC050543 TaxID=3364054 RepID=UPI0037B1C2AB
MTLTMASGRDTVPVRLITLMLVACCIALGITVSPLAAGKAHAATCNILASSLDCVSISSAAAPLAPLTFQGLSSNNGTTPVISTDPTGATGTWRLNPTPGSGGGTFSLLNLGTNKCIEPWSSTGLHEQPCSGGESQKWFLQPLGGGTGSGRGFMIRHNSSYSCLNANGWASGSYVTLGGCGTANPYQEWKFITQTQSSLADTLAVTFASHRCQGYSFTCYWTEQSESAPAHLPAKCISDVWYNDFDAPFNYTFTKTKMRGWQNSWGFTLTQELETGALSELVAKVKVSLAVRFDQLWSGQDTTTNSVTVPAQPHKYNYIALDTLAETVTGNFTFDVGGMPWTAYTTLTVPLKDSPGDTSYYMAAASTTRPSC